MSEARVRQGMTALGTAGVAALIAAAYVVGSGGGGSSAKADTPATPTPNVVTVDGTGKATGTPDTMVTTFSVTFKGANPGAALNGANKSMALVQHTLTARGIAAKDLQTTGLSVNPNYVYAKGRQSIQGYVAEEDLSVTLRQLSRAGATITAVTKAGGSHVSVGGITLDLEGDSALITNARAAAYADAKAKAQQYAALADRTLGSIVSVTETTNQSQPQVFQGYAAAASAAAAPVPIAAGSQDVAVAVTVVWTLN
jgi:uncharacterized protein